jgi:hypothetical protein
VSIAGDDVRLTISDLTRHRSFTKVLRATVLDSTSAEWIVEAPSVCNENNVCRTLPLADFGSAAFTSASTVTTAGYRGTIADRHWTTTKIVLDETGRRFVGFGGPAGQTFAGATPSALTSDGSAFAVTYDGATTTSGTTAASGTTGSTGSSGTTGSGGSGGSGAQAAASLYSGAARIVDIGR